MDKELFIADLKPGQSFQNVVAVRSAVQRKEAKNGAFLTMMLADCSGRKDAKKFQATTQEQEIAASSQFLRVSGTVETGAFNGQLNLTSLHPTETPADLTPFLPLPPRDHGEQQRRFSGFVKSVCEPNLHRLLRTIFDAKAPTWRAFCNAFAAKAHHHAYRGGLLEHSAEVAAFCDQICAIRPALRRDLLITAALLHDIGKLDEMDHGLAAGEFTDSGTLEGHVFSGAYRVRQASDNIPGFPQNLKSGLAHLILSHHGLPEYGAAKQPACAEAHVLSQCDLMSARIHECHTAATLTDRGQISVRLPGREARYLYVGDLGLTLPAPEIVPLYPTPAVSVSPAPPEILSFTTTRRLPVLGLVAAGSPGQSSDEELETRDVILPPSGADYLLRVTGDSMIDAGMHEGDLLFVRHQKEANNGDIVVANLAAQGQVVKKLRREGGSGVWLDSQNAPADYPPIALTEIDEIQGRVTGLQRDYR